MKVISNKTEKELANKGWNNVNREGFMVVLYVDDFSTLDWEDICNNAGVDTEVNHIRLLCVACNAE